MSALGFSLAKKLKDIRKRKRKTQEEFAETLGLARATINRWESKGAGTATLDEVDKISSIIGINPLILLKPENEPLLSSHTFQDCLDAITCAAAQGAGGILIAKAQYESLRGDETLSAIGFGPRQEQIIPKQIQEKLAKLDPIERETLLEMLESNADSFLLDKSKSDSDAG